MSRWFRFYDEALNDPKVQMLPADDFRSWVNLLCLASKNDGKLPDVAAMAFALRVTENAIETIIERLSNAGLIDKVNGGANGYHYAPHGWSKRQYKSDTSNERVKRHREKSRNVTVTPPETEADTETETEDLGPNGPVDDERQPPLSVDEIVGAWNELAGRKGLPKVAKITEARRKAMRARIRENTIEEWQQALAAVERSKHCCGDNDRGWRADLDFLLQPKSFTRLIEGFYDGAR